ncbi:hypothetical protein DPMN_082721 [Dreissena polymorpha]|uniref:Uncharacterized protein n=1 Tax=Dreissena polymorpha TaxID=45954 RepID=A0A9D3YB37_DREPO|nr:hypothetical protein DPMN_082721 [Dreissena polymorpha]
MIRRNVLTQSHYFPVPAPVEAGQQPGRVPVNPDWLRFIPVKHRQSPGFSPVVHR